MPTDWDPGTYARFAAERAQPFHDLLGLVRDRPIGRAVDLGCGTGELTALAADRLGIGDLVGIDSSPAMLAQATGRARPGLRFEPGDLATWSSAGDVDLVLANASLQWVPDHRVVLAGWARALVPRGQLAVQVPANASHPSHRAVADACLDEPFRSAMGGEVPADPVATNVLAPEEYAELLDRLGFGEQHVRLQVYGHRLRSSDDVVEWVRGTTMNRVFARLPEELHQPFVDAVHRHLDRLIGRQAPYFYAFRRILMWGRLERP